MRWLILFILFSGLIFSSCQSKAKEKTNETAVGNVNDSMKVNEKLKESIKPEEDGDADTAGMAAYLESMHVDSADQAYDDFRTELTEPPYGLKKIEALIEGIKDNEDGDDDDETEALRKSSYDSLTFPEKFTYHMIYRESYSQICDFIPPPKKANEKIFAQLPEVYDEHAWSDRQIKFLKDNRDSVMALIKATIQGSKRLGLNYKHAIEEINGKEMVPFLIDVYNRDQKDSDILTLLMILMKEGKYKPFVSSPMFQKLYGDKSDYDSFVGFNTATRDLVIKQATGFYNGLKK